MKRLICPYIPGKMPKFPFILKKLIQAPAIIQSRDRQCMSAFGSHDLARIYEFAMQLHQNGKLPSCG